MSNIDHKFTSEAVCPWCGHKHRDSWEWSDEGVSSCEVCERKFSFSRYVEVTYETEKIEESTTDE